MVSKPNIRFAGQITGVEGYVESAAMGFIAGKFTAAEILGNKIMVPPATTAIGSLLTHLTSKKENENFQPMNVNFGLFPLLKHGKKGRRNRPNRYQLYTDRAKNDWTNWLEKNSLI
tara:strand:- start:218 stop:565 length:348 start_codon:yes stop_codon:yes gene_type:complete